MATTIEKLRYILPQGVSAALIPSMGGDYAATSDGRIWNLKGPEPVECKCLDSGKWRYKTFCVRVNGVQRNHYFHTAILEAFKGPRPEGMVCCHYDGDRMNNNIDNLRWDTPLANAADKVRHGRTNLIKLTPETENEIVRRYLMYIENLPSKITKDFGISKQALSHVLKRRGLSMDQLKTRSSTSNPTH